jgi:hypothetical protein
MPLNEFIIKHHTMKPYGEVGEELHAFLISARAGLLQGKELLVPTG